MENKNVISIKNLVKRFPVGGDYFTALQQVSLELSEGEFIGLVGPSGSGKTNLLNIIGGLDSATDGSVSVLRNSMENTSHNKRAEIRRKHMGFIFQSYNLLPVYTVYENVELPLILNNIDKTERDLKSVFEKETWNKRHLQIIFFGREYCPALRHDLERCPICSWAASKKRIRDEMRK